MTGFLSATVFFWSFLLLQSNVAAQDSRGQYPKLLSKAYFGVDIGNIDYAFDQRHLTPGYIATKVSSPGTAVRLTLYGYHFNKHFSGRISYMRPVNWVFYSNVNGDDRDHIVKMNFGGLTFRGETPIAKSWSVFGEAGLGIVTRNGFEIDGDPVVKNTVYPSLLSTAGIQFNLNKKWQLNCSATYSPANSRRQQPATKFYSAGFQYNLQPLPNKQVMRNTNPDYIYPRRFMRIGYTTNLMGYGVNKLVSEGTVPIFWGGDVEIQSGLSADFQQNVFHTGKVFSLDVGAGAGYWKTRNSHKFYSVSVYPVLRFMVLRTNFADFYFYYSVAGPSFLSKRYIDQTDIGRKFTFRDFMGIGSFIGKKRNLDAGISIGHFSNGNIFPTNPGVKVPLTFSVGHVF